MPHSPLLPANPDVVIIGAGAAGIGAGLALTRLGIPFIILEAKDRTGGRAFSDTASIGHLWDQGAHWFHAAERNPLRMIAERIGHPFEARQEEWSTRWVVDGRTLSAAEQADGSSAMAAAMEASDQAGLAGRDISQAEAAGGLPEPFGPFTRFVFEAIGSGRAEDMSAVDVARYDGGEGDFPVSGGYGTLIAKLGADLPVRLNCTVQAITPASGGLSVATTAGTLRTRAVILTVSNNVLLAGHIRIEPGLPADLRSAIEQLPCGDCEKIAVELTGDDLSAAAGEKLLVQHGGDVFSLHVQPYGRPIATAYIAGDHARRAGGLSVPDAGALLSDVLAGVYGSKIRNGLGRSAMTGWSRDPHILGAYSYARAGQAAARPLLMAADLAPLFLAGEAHLLDWYSTAHGAHISGTQTAHKVARFLGYAPPAADPLWLPQGLEAGAR